MDPSSQKSSWEELGIDKRIAAHLYASVMTVGAGAALFFRYVVHREWSTIAWRYLPFLLCVTLFYLEASKKLSPLTRTQAAMVLFLLLFMVVGFPFVLYWMSIWGFLGN